MEVQCVKVYPDEQVMAMRMLERDVVPWDRSHGKIRVR